MTYDFVRSNFPWSALEPLDEIDEAFAKGLVRLPTAVFEERIRVARLQRWLTTIGHPTDADGIVGEHTLVALDKAMPNGFSFDKMSMTAIVRAMNKRDQRYLGGSR